MATADFKINSTLQATRGYDATTSESITLTLENAPAVDVSSVVYSVVASSADAPSLTLSPSTGIPTTPTGTVTFTMPASGFHSYCIQCQVNAGKSTNSRGALVVNADYTKQRIIAIRGAVTDLRKTVPAETTQYESDGWSVALNELMEAQENGSVGGIPTTRTLTAGAGLTGGGDLSSDRTFNVVAHADASIVVNANDIQVGALGFTRVQTALAAASGSIAVNSQKITGLAAGVDPTDAANVSQLIGTTYTAGDGLTESPSGTFNVGATDTTVTIAANGIKVATGGITNTEVNASAAIAGSKISPSFGAQNISQSGATAITAGSGGFVGIKLDYAGALAIGGTDATSIGIGSASITTTITGVAVIQKDAIGSSDVTGLLLDNTTSSGSSEQRPPIIQQGGYGHKTGGGGSQVKCYATRRVRLQDGTSNPDIEVIEQYDLGGSVAVFGTWTTNLPSIAGTGLYLNSTLALGGASNGVRSTGTGNPGLAFDGSSNVQIKASATDYHVVLGAAQMERRSFDYSTPTNNYTAYASDVQTTTDATATNVWTYAMPDNSSVIFDVDVYCYDTSNPGLRAYFGRRGFYNRNGGAPTEDDTQDKYTDVVVGAWGSPPACVIAVGPGTNDVSVKVTGLLAQNIKWITKITRHVGTTSA